MKVKKTFKQYKESLKYSFPDIINQTEDEYIIEQIEYVKDGALDFIKYKYPIINDENVTMFDIPVQFIGLIVVESLFTTNYNNLNIRIFFSIEGEVVVCYYHSKKKVHFKSIEPKEFNLTADKILNNPIKIISIEEILHYSPKENIKTNLK